MEVVEIYRSFRLADCEQRAFLLYAVGIASQITPVGGEFVLFVAEEMRDAAVLELLRHEAEARSADGPPPEPIRLHAYAWVGALGYSLVLLLCAWAAGESLFGQDWREAGALRAALAASGDWHRLITALTLHADVGHLIANLVFGVFFGYLAGQLLGVGVAWLSILIGAVLGNLLDSVLMPTYGASIGASTAVFATLGMVAAHSWRRRDDARTRWAQRFAPLVAGIALLAFTGAGDENTDVIAHVAGFACGAVVGVLHAWKAPAWLESSRAQIAAGVATLSLIAGAWLLALS
jgi:membrane associated rhomboid family serine protease